jgi:hypothetical protein
MSSESPIVLAYGNFEYKTSIEFVVALLVAMMVVLLFSIRKFGESTMPRDEGDLVTQLLPKHLATREQYSRAHMLYVTLMALLVIGISIIGPQIVGSVGGIEVPQVQTAMPLFVALVLVGALPNVSWLPDVEKALRAWTHRKAFIPESVQTDVTRLQRADFDFKPFACADVIASGSMRGVSIKDFEQARGSVESMWARLSCIVHRLAEIQNGSLAANFDEDVLRSYADDVDRIFLRRKALEDDVAEYRRLKSKNPHHDSAELKQKIGRTLRHLYVLLACGVRLQKGKGDIAAALQPFGFELRHEQISRTDNTVILACGAILVIAFSMVQGAVWFGQLARSSSLWTPSAYFPAEPIEPFPWAFTLLLTHGSAIVVADWLRRRRLSRASWFAGSEQHRVYANYVRVAALCACTGFAALYFWGAVMRGFSLALAKEQLSYVVLPAVTGTFYAYYLDSVELRTSPSKAGKIAAQALCTALFGFIAADVWMSTFAAQSAVRDLPLFVGVLNGTVGGGLAWFVLKAAGARPGSAPASGASRSSPTLQSLETNGATVIPMRQVG